MPRGWFFERGCTNVTIKLAMADTYLGLVVSISSIFGLLIGASLSEPHINVKFVQFVCLSVCRSVRTFMTRKYTRVIKTHDSESRGQEETGRI